METVLFYNQRDLMRIHITRGLWMRAGEVAHGTLFTSMRLILFFLFSVDIIQFSLTFLFNITIFETFNVK